MRGPSGAAPGSGAASTPAADLGGARHTRRSAASRAARAAASPDRSTTARAPATEGDEHELAGLTDEPGRRPAPGGDGLAAVRRREHHAGPGPAEHPPAPGLQETPEGRVHGAGQLRRPRGDAQIAAADVLAVHEVLGQVAGGVGPGQRERARGRWARPDQAEELGVGPAGVAGPDVLGPPGERAQQEAGSAVETALAGDQVRGEVERRPPGAQGRRARPGRLQRVGEAGPLSGRGGGGLFGRWAAHAGIVARPGPCRRLVRK